MWKKKPPFRLALNRAASDEIAPHCKHYTESGVRKLHESGTALAEDPEAPVSKMPDSSEAHDQASLKSAKDRDGEPYPAFASEKSRTEASGKTGSEKKFYHNVSSGADFAAQPPVTTMTVASTVLTADTVPRRQVPMIPNMQKTVEVPQVDEASDLDAFGLVQGGQCTRVVDESEAQGPEDELVPVAPNMGAGGSHPQATLNQEWAEDLREIRRMVEFLVRRERKLDVKADVAIRRLERLERENLQLEDEVLESSLPDALADRTKVVKLVVDKWFVDKGFGFGKVPSGEVVFIHASVVQGAEVLMIGTEAWVQVVSDDARAQGGGSEPGEPGERPRGSKRETGKGRAKRQSVPDERPSSRQSWRPSPNEQCPRCAPILRACLATSQLQSAVSCRQPVTAPSLPEATLSCQNEAP